MMKKKLMLLIAALLTVFVGKITTYPTFIAHSDEDPPFFSDEHYEDIQTQHVDPNGDDTINVEITNGTE